MAVEVERKFPEAESPPVAENLNDPPDNDQVNQGQGDQGQVNIPVVVESLNIKVQYDGDEAPLLYNYQEFKLGGKTNVSIQVDCPNCQKLIVNS